MTCCHCEAEATSSDANEGDSLRCETCGILGTVFQREGDVDTECGPFAVAYLRFEANDGERCKLSDCEECR